LRHAGNHRTHRRGLGIRILHPHEYRAPHPGHAAASGALKRHSPGHPSCAVLVAAEGDAIVPAGLRAGDHRDDFCLSAHPFRTMLGASLIPRRISMSATTYDVSTLRARREAVVRAHIEAEAVHHDVAAALATFKHPKYDVPALGGVVD